MNADTTAPPAASATAAPLRVAVMGAGAVGCFYGGMLARAGHVVTLIGRPAHVQAVRQHGLRLQALGFDEAIAMAADTEPAAAAGADLVLLAVKSTDTESAAAALAPYLGPQAVLLTLQNGVDNDARARALLAPREVIASVVYVATEMAGPGHVRHHGRGELVLAPSPSSARIAAALSAAGVPSEVSPDVRAALWLKLVLNCAYNALSAIGRQPYGRLVQVPGVAALLQGVVAECQAVAQADGVALDAAELQAAVQRIAETMPTQFSSTAQDLRRGRRTEIAHLNGHVVARGAALGVPTPINQTLLTLVKVLEAGLQAPGDALANA